MPTAGTRSCLHTCTSKGVLQALGLQVTSVAVCHLQSKERKQVGVQSSTLGSSRKSRVKGCPRNTGLERRRICTPHGPMATVSPTRTRDTTATGGPSARHVLLLFPVFTTRSSMRFGEVAGLQLSLLLAVVPSLNHPTAI